MPMTNPYESAVAIDIKAAATDPADGNGVLGICSLVFSGFSILFPVTCVGIWALMDSKIKSVLTDH